ATGDTATGDIATGDTATGDTATGDAVTYTICYGDWWSYYMALMTTAPAGAVPACRYKETTCYQQQEWAI
ncbi:TPA: hypothetical protein ACGRG7_001391, partial [Morganella morganii]